MTPTGQTAKNSRNVYQHRALLLLLTEHCSSCKSMGIAQTPVSALPGRNSPKYFARWARRKAWHSTVAAPQHSLLAGLGIEQRAYKTFHLTGSNAVLLMDCLCTAIYPPGCPRE